MGSVFLFLFCPLFSECGWWSTCCLLSHFWRLWRWMEYCGTNQILCSGISSPWFWSRQIFTHHSDFQINLDVNALIITSSKLLVWWNNGNFHCSLQEFHCPGLGLIQFNPQPVARHPWVPTHLGAGYIVSDSIRCDLREHRGSKARNCNLVTLLTEMLMVTLQTYNV
jgi:hypothetical protein